jgi:hypothetical protein
MKKRKVKKKLEALEFQRMLVPLYYKATPTFFKAGGLLESKLYANRKAAKLF